jgi:protein-S-isoprenylcysteine O-methyltransferase Ste14
MLDYLILLQVAVWAIFATVWIIMLPPKKDGEKHHQRSSYNGALYVSGILSVSIYLFRFTEIEPLFPWQRELGVVVSALGLTGAIYSRIVIGLHWSFHATARTDGELVERFPYNIVRHPIYSAQLVMCAGTALTSSNIAVALIFIGGSYLLLWQRAVKEEALLNLTSQGSYSERFARKGRFFPRLGGKKESGRK